jgi:hypothetical protein
MHLLSLQLEPHHPTILHRSGSGAASTVDHIIAPKNMATTTYFAQTIPHDDDAVRACLIDQKLLLANLLPVDLHATEAPPPERLVWRRGRLAKSDVADAYAAAMKSALEAIPWYGSDCAPSPQQGADDVDHAMCTAGHPRVRRGLASDPGSDASPPFLHATVVDGSYQCGHRAQAPCATPKTPRARPSSASQVHCKD